MKTSALVLAAILVRNALTAWVSWSLASRSSAPSGASAAAEGAAEGRVESTALVAAATGSPPLQLVTNFVTQPFHWRQVESEDYRQYVANLRAIGCPEATVRDIVVADVNGLFSSRARALHSGNTNRPAYWKPVAMGFSGTADEAGLAQQQQLAAERRALLAEILGQMVPEKTDTPAGFNPFEELLDFLPADKQVVVTEVQQRLKVRQASAMSQGDSAALKSAYGQRDAELGHVLTPEEKFEYDLRTSPTAQFLRMQTGGFEFDEQEFRAVFKLQKEFDDQFGLPRLRSNEPAEVARRNVAQKELDAQIKGTLGEDRYQQLLTAMTQRRAFPHGLSH
jgi:hypothetical protein